MDVPLELADDPSLHPCARCARMQKTCCQQTEILVTEGDIARIAAHTGRNDFWSLRVPNYKGHLEHDPSDPNWRSYTVDEENRRRMLLKQPNGDCTFLGEAGCVLPLEVRPLVCRLYPFAFTEHGGIVGIDDSYCPTDKLLPHDQPGVTMLTVLGMDIADGRRWRDMLYAELRSQTPGRKA